VPHTLLLADDSVTIQRVIELTFADEDVQVVAVSDGDRAIAVLDETPPDIVLADVGMPNKSGYDVARHVKGTPRLAHIPVVLLTGAFEPVDESRAAAVGCDAVLAKPFEPQLVIARVKELLARHPGLVPEPIAVADQLEAAAAAVAPASEKRDLDDYFDRLDQAFSTLTDSSASRPTSMVGEAAIPDEPVAEIHPVGSKENVEPFTLAAPPPPLEMLEPLSRPESLRSEPWTARGPEAAEPLELIAPLEPVAPAEPFEPPAPLERPEPSELPVPLRPPHTLHEPLRVPSLAEAFAALLEAEHAAAPGPRPSWPASEPPRVAVSGEVVDQVTRQVLDRLSDGVVRETVSDIVSGVAERLVREEIERIKSNIR
jgi:CheY-like chemotaxis protein